MVHTTLLLSTKMGKKQEVEDEESKMDNNPR